MVPAPDLTAAEVQAAAAAIAASPEQHRRDGRVLHALEVVMQHATGIVCFYEALLRDAATLCETAAQLEKDRGSAAAAPAAAAQLQMSGAEAAEEHLQKLMRMISALGGHDVTGSFPHKPSALALAALSAGPGSDLQRQLFSLMCTMVKLGNAAVSDMISQATAGKSAAGCRGLVRAAAHTAAALLEGARGTCQRSTDGGSHVAAAAVSMLAGLFVFGWCCLWWAEGMQKGGALEVFAQRLVQQPHAA
jgi:hypothetical protein